MNVFWIAQRELRATFSTTIGWLVLAGYLLISGIFWSSMVSYYVMQSTDVIANPYAASNMNLTDYLLSPFFGNVSVVLLMVCPAISMRMFSEDLKQRTMELLFTSPISTAEIVLGKFLGALGFVAVLLLSTAYVPASLYFWGTPDLGALAGGYLSLLLSSAAILAMGLLFSSMTPNQIVALVLTFAGALGLWILPWLSQDPDALVAKLAITSHVEDLVRGALQVSDLVYFAAFIGFFLFATHQRVESHRWS